MRWPFTRRSADWRKSRKRSASHSHRLAFDALEDRRLLTASPGSLDPTFGTGGIAGAAFPYPQPSSDSGQLVVAEPDGGLIVGSLTNAPTSNSQSSNFALTGYDAAGAVDTSFGTAGTVLIPTLQFSVAAMALGPSGQLIVAGTENPNTSNSEFEVEWFSATGVLQNSVTTPLSGSATAVAVAAESNGQVVVAGWTEAATYPYGYELAVARYDTDGSLDGSFGTGGVAIGPTNSGRIEGHAAMAIQTNGQIVVGGDGFAVSRFNPDGSLDTAFGTNGLAAVPTAYFSYVTALAIQPNGQILAAGVEAPSDYDYYGTNTFMLARFNADGTLDMSFGTAGVATDGISGIDQTPSSVQLLADGSIVVTDSTDPNPFSHYPGTEAIGSAVLVNFSSGGQLNTAFGQNGIAQLTQFGDANSLGAADGALLPDGDIVVVGQAYYPPYEIFQDPAAATDILDFNASGALDVGFNGTGGELVHLGDGIQPGGASATCEAIQPDGKLVIVGVAQGVTATPGALALARFNRDGSLDTSFGTDGTAVWDQVFTPNAVAIEPDGQIVVVGEFFGSNAGFAVVQYNANGSIDTSFGNQGVVTTNVGGYSGSATSVAVDASRKIVVAGYIQTTNMLNEVVVRYNEDGSLDTTFNGTGIFTDSDTPIDDDGLDGGPVVAIQADGKIVVGGDGLLRLNADGTLDTTFGPGGVISEGSASVPAPIDQLVVEPNGTILVAGDSPSEFATSDRHAGGPYLERFNANGSADPTFDAGQPLVEPDPNQIWGLAVTGLAVASDGLIAVTFSGSISSTVNDENAIVLDPGGSLDQTLDNPFSGTAPYSSAVAFDSAGNILLTGSGPDLTVARFAAVPAPPSGPPVTASTPGTLALFAASGSVLSVQLATPTSFVVTIDGNAYDFSTSQYDAVQIFGASGSTVTLSGDFGDATATFSPQTASIATANLSLDVESATNIYIYGDAQATAVFFGTVYTDNTLVDASTYAYMNGPDGDNRDTAYSNFAVGFGQTYADAASSQDTAYFYAGAGATYVATSNYAYLSQDGYFNSASGFASTLAVATSNTAQAWLYSPLTGGTFYAGNAYSYLSGSLAGGSSFFNEVTGFQSVTGVSTGASDYAYLVDTAGGAAFSGNAASSSFIGASFNFQAIGFANIVATGTANDTADVYDTTPGDTLDQQGSQISLVRSTGTTLLDSFGKITGHFQTSYGQALLDTIYADLG